MDEFVENLNASIVKGLRSNSKNIYYTRKFQISAQFFTFLKNKYQMKFSIAPCIDLMGDMRVVRALFINERDYARAAHIKFAIRKSRRVVFKSFKNGKLVERYFYPSPYFVVNFLRDDQKFNHM